MCGVDHEQDECSADQAHGINHHDTAALAGTRPTSTNLPATARPRNDVAGVRIVSKVGSKFTALLFSPVIWPKPGKQWRFDHRQHATLYSNGVCHSRRQITRFIQCLRAPGAEIPGGESASFVKKSVNLPRWLTATKPLTGTREDCLRDKTAPIVLRR